MKKGIIQLFILVGLFAGVWFALSLINWEKVLHKDEVSEATEKKLGDIFWDMMKNGQSEMESEYSHDVLDSILVRVCKANNIADSSIKLHVVDQDEINAFAFPNGHIVINRGLIENCDNAEQLTGILCHELAHVQQRHVMKKLMKEVGLSVLISISTGNYDNELVRNIIHKLSSTAYDREMEKEADLIAVSYLYKAKVDAKPLSTFLFRLSEQEENMPKYVYWISTHPDSKERAAYVLEKAKEHKYQAKPVLHESTFKNLQKVVEELSVSSK